MSAAAPAAVRRTSKEGPSIKAVHPSEALVADDHYAIIDVRSTAERLTSFIPSAFHVELTDLVERGAASMAAVHARHGPGKDLPLLMQCRSGRRSYRAAEALVAAGYTDVTNLEGGIVEWEAKGLPTAAAAAATAADDIDAATTMSVREFVDLMEEAFLDEMGSGKTDEGETEALRKEFREVIASAGVDAERPRRASMEGAMAALGDAGRGRTAFASIAKRTKDFLTLLSRVRDVDDA